MKIIGLLKDCWVKIRKERLDYCVMGGFKHKLYDFGIRYKGTYYISDFVGDYNSAIEHFSKEIGSEFCYFINKLRDCNGFHSNSKSYLKISVVLSFSTLKGLLPIVRKLVDMDATLHDISGEFLYSASGAGHIDIVRYFIEKSGKNFVRDIGSSLVCASGEGHLDIVKYLWGKGSYTYDEFKTAFDKAKKNNHESVVEFFKEKM